MTRTNRTAERRHTVSTARTTGMIPVWLVPWDDVPDGYWERLERALSTMPIEGEDDSPDPEPLF